MDIPIANRANNNLVPVYEVDYIGNRPNTVSIRPVRRAGRNVDTTRSFALLANGLRTRVIRELRDFLGWNTTQVRRNVTGTLMMYNRDNIDHTYTADFRVVDIVGNSFEDHFERATGNGSNAIIDLYSVEWRFWINPASFQGGGGLTFKNPRKFNGISSWDFKFKEFSHCDVSLIGCAAISLGLGLVRKKEIEISNKRVLKDYETFAKHCEDLQSRMEFPNPKFVTISQMEKFVKLYKEFRLVIIQSAFTKSFIYSGSKYAFNADHKIDKTIYIFHDLETEHYVYCNSPQELARSMRNSDTRWCYQCCSYYRYNSETSCDCGNSKGEKKDTKKICEHCNAVYYRESNHVCGEIKCHYCSLFFKAKETRNHRCPLHVKTKDFMKVWKYDENNYGQECTEKDQSELWCWDIESYLVPTLDNTLSFETDENGKLYLDDNDMPVSYTIKKNRQLPNYIACENVFTGEKKVFEDIKDFVKFTLTHNDGYNTFLAHNSSSYDSRLLFETISEMSSSDSVEPIFRGTKFMRLVMNRRTVFQDTLLHLTRSLSELGDAFGLKQEKGHFPHLFNTLENLNYSGPIPAKEFFDLTFSCKSKKHFVAFNEWHDSWKGKTWNFKEQRELYCINDVTMLCQIVKMYHEETIKGLADYPYLTISPWFFPTLAGHVHKLMLRHLHEGHNIEEMDDAQLQEYTQTTWATLEPEEFYFAKSALRGGSTNICRYVFEGKYHYQDIQSSYPSVQMDKQNLYPVGTPVIEIHDTDYYPCKICCNKLSCNHSFQEKVEFVSNVAFKQKLKIKEVSPENLHEYCLQFFGIICVDLLPPRDLYHPLIQGYDAKRGKVIGTLEPIIKETITSAHLHEAIKVGYKVTKIYRADRYRSAESIYRNGLLGHLYVSKMKNSGKAPTGLDREIMQNRFMDEFNIDLGDMDKWEKNKVLKAIAKGPPTAAWGKHAESVDHPKSQIFGDNDELGMEFYKSLMENKAKLSNVRSLGDNRTMFTYRETRENVRPDLHKGYMPVAVFVTSYGRLKLWRELHKLGKRVIMYDTDSIVYSCDCCDGKTGYRISEGNCLGDWETEDFETENGLAKFYAIGPKSYSLVGENGKETMKLKGACVRYAHEDMINPTVMRDMVVKKKQIFLPQMSFDFSHSKGMTTRKYHKLIQFHEKDVKGTFNWEEYRAYPFGYVDPNV